MDPAASGRPFFTAEADAEPGFSGYTHHNPVLPRPISWTRSRSSLRNMYTPSTVSSPRSGRFFDARFEDHRPHFLESCFLCKKPLGNNRDIFMYRGDTPFCSEACRQEQMEMDDAREKKRSLSSMKAMRKKDQRKSASPSKGQEYPLRTGTVAAA